MTSALTGAQRTGHAQGAVSWCPTSVGHLLERTEHGEVARVRERGAGLGQGHPAGGVHLVVEGGLALDHAQAPVAHPLLPATGVEIRGRRELLLERAAE